MTHIIDMSLEKLDKVNHIQAVSEQGNENIMIYICYNDIQKFLFFGHKIGYSRLIFGADRS